MDIHDRVQLLEDSEAIEKTKLRQMRALDAVVNDDSDIAALENELSPDFRWRCEQFGNYPDREAYKEFISTYTQRVTFSLHFLSGSVTHISSDRSRAEGKWVVWQPFTVDGAPWLLAGRSRDEFTRHDDRWLVSTTELIVEILSPWATNWGENRISSDWQWPAR